MESQETMESHLSQPNPRQRSSASRGFEIALSHIQNNILNGTYVVGTRLPPERDLATQLGISRTAVREALRVLQAQGIIVASTGRGNGTRIQAAPIDALANLLRLHLALESASFVNLTETRIALERAASAAAARNGDPASLAKAQDLLDEMVDCLDQEHFNKLDTQFHIAIADASDNRLIRDITVAIRHAVQNPIHEAETQHQSWSKLRDILNSEHRAMLEAIREGDPQKAANTTEDHIRHAYQLLFPNQ